MKRFIQQTLAQARLALTLWVITTLLLSLHEVSDSTYYAGLVALWWVLFRLVPTTRALITHVGQGLRTPFRRTR